MTRTLIATISIFMILGFGANICRAQSKTLKIIFIRHGEKPLTGNNLTCQGLNRSLRLPAVIVKKFGVPDFLFVPAIGDGEVTKHARMFQTVSPLAIRYNLKINSFFPEDDSVQIANYLKQKNGVILVCWEHKAIAPIVRALGVGALNLTWPDTDYDSIWIVTYKDGRALFKNDKQDITPETGCMF